MYLRNYEESDAEIILSWINNERDFRLWSADRYGKYPITSSDINLNYKECKKCGNFYPMTLIDEENNIIGHLIFRNPGENISIVRLGFIILDNKVRGKGIGKSLLNLAIKYATEVMNATEICLGVFKNNESAYRCYFSVGFREIGVERCVYNFYGESWDVIEMKLKNTTKLVDENFN